MQPTQFNYPEFVPDQILTSSNLNDMFDYLDEQDRLTRTNLIGVGIVCGLEVSVNASYTQLTISAGCGITSGGYLVTFPQKTFTQYKDYNALKQLYYEKFVDGVSKTQRYKLDELFETAVVEGASPLSKDYLKDKVVLLYVELLEDQAKNCDPGSCDDKGKNIDITFRPLLISINDAAKLKTAGANYGDAGTNYKTLPKLKMLRYNVPATVLSSTTQVLDVYRKILSASFIDKVQNALTQTYTILQPLIKDIYPTDPFAQLSTNMAFLNNGSLTELEAINYQYYYDLFSDVELAYSELRETGMEALSLCCPDVNLFRLHLLLGNAIPGNADLPLANRQYFIPSPVMECHCKQTNRLRWLFKRIQLLLQNFYAGYGVTGNFGDLYTPEQLKARQLNNNIRITPSSLGTYPLAKKAIPFYYMPVEGAGSLVDNWDIEKTADGEADQNLSYNSNLYATDDHVLNPLNYDLEPFNFLRVEGHIGMNYTTALKGVVGLRDQNRLPFDVVALGTDLGSLKTALADLGKTSTVAALVEKYADRIKTPCQFQDIDTLYDTLIAEITCQLCRTMLYFYQLNEPVTAGGNPVRSKVPLVLKCNPEYYVQPATFGFFFEQFYANYKKDGIAFMYRSFDKQGFTPINIYFFFLLYIEQFFETFTSSLGNFDFAAFTEAYKRMISIANDIKNNLSSQTDNDPVTLATLEQLKKLIGMCVQKPIEALYRDYLLRWVRIMMLQKFGYFARKHPGIQHKAGVPMGGTFVMVYHEVTVADPTKTNNSTDAATHANSVREQAADVVLAQANQSPQEVLKLFGLDTSKAQRSSQKAGAKINMEEAAGGKVMAEASGSQGVFEINAPEYSGPASHFDDLNAFKTENQAELDELGILLQGINTTQSQLADAVAEIGNGIVIADFYLPYMCCSDCPPIQFTVNEVAETLTIAVPPGVFCGADDKIYNINVTPDGGEVTGEGASGTAEGKFVFNPSVVKFAAADKARDITLTYKAFGQSITTKVTVYQKPAADFGALAIGGGATVTITNSSSAFADKYSWEFGDGQTSLDKDPAPHTYTKDGTYTIKLTVSNNNICTDVKTKDITILTPGVNIDIDKKTFCSDDSNAYPIVVSPPDAVVTGEGVIFPGGTASFQPKLISLNNAASKTITLTAQKNEKQKSVDVTVFQQPAADFAIVPQTDKPGTISFINKSPSFVTGYQWTFGDTSPASTDETPPPHTYTTEGDHTITLVVYNNDCKGIPKTINYNVQLPKPEIDIVPKLFCIQDDKTYPISVGADGGTVTGDGVSQLADGSYIFKPSAVPVFPTATRPVIFTNTLNGVPMTVEVTLYGAPIVKFSTVPGGTSPFSVQFINETEKADKFQWIFDTQGTSDQRDPIFTFSTPGVINVTLRASNADMCKGLITQPVTVGQQLIAKTCLPVGGILEQFNGLKQIDTKNFSAFVKAFPALSTELKPFFDSLSGADGSSTTDQVTLFKDLKATDLIPKWIDALTRLLEKNITLAGLTAALVKILSQLIEHIACIQPADINKANVPMTDALNTLGTFSNTFLAMVKKATAVQKQQLATAIDQMNKMNDGLKEEVQRVASNGETTTKTNYVAALKKIIKLFVA